jgi:hypothetical protein
MARYIVDGVCPVLTSQIQQPSGVLLEMQALLYRVTWNRVWGSRLPAVVGSLTYPVKGWEVMYTGLTNRSCPFEYTFVVLIAVTFIGSLKLVILYFLYFRKRTKKSL